MYRLTFDAVNVGVLFFGAWKPLIIPVDPDI